jgi:hypothetical protein
MELIPLIGYGMTGNKTLKGNAYKMWRREEEEEGRIGLELWTLSHLSIS